MSALRLVNRPSGRILPVLAIILMMVMIPSPVATVRSSAPAKVSQTVVTPFATPDYSLSASPTSLSMAPGATQTVTITATSLNGFAGSVYLNTGFSYPAAESVNPTILTLTAGGSATSTLTVALPTSALPGNYTQEVESVGGCSLFHYTFVSLRVTAPDFSITPSKDQLTVSTTAADTTDLNLRSIDGFSGTVSVFAFSSYFAITPSSASVTLTPGGTGSTGALSVVANSGTLPGNYTLDFDASSGSLFHLASVVVTVTGPSFGLTANNQFLTLVAGGTSNNSIITVTPISGFTGTVTLTANPSTPAGLIGGLSAGTVTLPPAQTSTLTVTAPTSTVPGLYDIRVDASGNGLTVSIGIEIRVKGPDYTLSANPTFVAVVEGSSSCTSTVMASAIDGFSGSIGLIQKNSGGLTITNTTTTLTLPGTASSVLTISAPTTAVPGFYVVAVNGTSGKIHRYAYIDVIVIGPDFDLNSSPSSLTVTVGSSTTSTVSLVPIDNFAGSVTLTATAFGSGITATPSPTSISTTTTSTLTVSAATGTTPGTYYTVQLTGTSGALKHAIYIPLTVVGPDFSISANPSPVTFNAGTAATSTITISPSLGFSDEVSFYPSPLSSNLNASISPTTVASNSYSATLSLNSTIPGSYSVDVTGYNTTDGLYHDVVITVTVNGPDFALTANPIIMNIAEGTSSTSSIGVTPLHGFTGSVSLTAGSVTGFSTSFNPISITTSQASTLTIAVDPSVSAGAYTVDVQGTSGHITHDVSITVQVSGFTLSADPTSLTIDQGSSQSSVITVFQQNGFTGTVMLTTRVNAGFTPSLTVTSIPGSGTSTLSLRASSSISPGTYLENVTGTSGGLMQRVTVTVTVPAPDFTIVPSSATTTGCTVGASCPTTITIAPLNGFTGTVTFSVKTPTTGFTCNTPSIVSGGSGSTTLSCTASVQGNYDVVVNGTSGSIYHLTGAITYQVVVGPDFTITAGAVSPAAIQAGASGTSSISVSPVGGFTGPVAFTITTSTPAGLTCQPLSSWTGSGTPSLSCSASVAGDYTVTVTGSATINSATVTRLTGAILFHVVDFTISASPTTVTVVTNVAGTSTMTVSTVNGFTGTVAVSSNNSACTLSPSSVTGGAGTSTLSCTFATAGTVIVTVTGTITGLSHTTTVTFTVNQAPDFSIAASAASVNLNSGTSTTSTISASGLAGFAGAIGLTSTVSPATGLSASFSTNSLTYGTSGYGTSTLSLSATSVGSYTVTVAGSSGSLTHNVVIHVTVPTPDFTIAGSSTAVGFVAGGSVTSTVTVAPLNGFYSTVTLTTTVSPSVGLTTSLSTTSIAYGAGSSTATFTSSTTGTYTVTITGTSGALSHAVTVQVTVAAPTTPDFTITASQTTVTIQAGSSGSSTLTIAPTNGFTGTVALSGGVSPSGPTTSFSPSSITGGSGTSTLRISVDSSVASGTYTVTVTGTSGNQSHSTTVKVTVTSSNTGATAGSILGLPSTDFYIIIAILAIVIVAGLGFALRTRGKKN